MMSVKLAIFLTILIVTSAYVPDTERRSRGRGRHRISQSRFNEMTSRKLNEEEGWNEENEATTTPQHPTGSNRRNRTTSSWRDRLFPGFNIGASHNHHFQFGPGLHFNVSSRIRFERAWWNGENVCIKEDTKEESSRRDSSEDDSIERESIFQRIMIAHVCEQRDLSYVCTTRRSTNGRTTTKTKTYQCCQGFALNDENTACEAEGQLLDLVSTLEQNSATEMVKALTITGLTQLVQGGNYTLFAPTNEAFDRYKLKDSERNVIVVNPSLERMSNGLGTSISAHIVPGHLRMSQMQDEELIPTEHPSAKIRINKYNLRGKLIQTANCAPVNNSNLKAQNGLVHIVGEVLQPVREDLKTIIRRRPELSKFNKAIENIDLDDDGNYTLFIPIDEAFDQLNPAILEKIGNPSSCGKDVIKHHILPNVICSATIQGQVRSRNVLHRFIGMSRDNDDDLHIETALVIEKDVMATNGVIHLINKVLIPPGVEDIKSVIERTGATEFLNILNNAGLEDRLGHLDQFTFFVPTNSALAELPKQNAENENSSLAEQILSNHMVRNKIPSRQFIDGMKLTTIDEGKEVVVNEYEMGLYDHRVLKTIQCAPIVSTDIQTCGGVLHVVDKLIIPASDNIMGLLEKRPEFSQLFSLVREAGLTDLLSGRHPLTLFAPTNEAFNNAPEIRNQLRGNAKKAQKFIKSHVIRGSLCCYGVFGHQYLIFQQFNIDGWMIPISRAGENVTYGRTPIESCDITATNGVIHSINEFSQTVVSHLLGNNGRRRHGNSRRDFWHDLMSIFD